MLLIYKSIHKFEVSISSMINTKTKALLSQSLIVKQFNIQRHTHFQSTFHVTVIQNVFSENVCIIYVGVNNNIKELQSMSLFCSEYKVTMSWHCSCPIAL